MNQMQIEARVKKMECLHQRIRGSKGYFYYETVIYLLWVQSPIRSNHLWTVFENGVSISPWVYQGMVAMKFQNTQRKNGCIKANNFVLNIIGNGYLIPFFQLPPTSHFKKEEMKGIIDQDDVHFSFAKI
jgi:hypothetical protein